MSVQFGRWNIDGRPVDSGYLEKTKDMLAPYGPDREGVYIKDGVGILHRAFHTTKESRKESQPLVTPSGSVLCWDGRLDNREELLRELREPLTAGATDLDVVATAYEAKGTGCLAKLVGDWALSVWEPKTRSVVLAKDPIGTRHLHYSFDRDQISWSTILDPLVLLAGKTFALEEEYIAGWLSFFPATHLTPYVGIHSVPPSCFIRLGPGRRTIQKYWDFDPSKRIRYKTDGEYEEHFRQVFREAVRRRLRSDSPILAELSGGMDSSSIVCMADTILEQEDGVNSRLDTISYFNDSEPNWDERPFFSKVEEKRGRIGCHIDVGRQQNFQFELRNGCFAASPGSGARVNGTNNQFADCLTSKGNRVVLCGIGGDEVTGGVPTPVPELEDLLVRAEFKTLARQLIAWALTKRRPWLHLLLEGLRGFLPSVVTGVPEPKRVVPWLNAKFAKRNRGALQGYESRLKLFGPRPSFQENLNTLEQLLRQLSCSVLPSRPPYEKRYPYLDRDLLVFLYSAPRDQLVRPGERRSLMRRTMVGIVPEEILHRKRKAFVARAPMVAIARAPAAFAEMARCKVSSSLCIINAERFSEALEKVRIGHEVPLVPLLRMLAIERWLGNLENQQHPVVVAFGELNPRAEKTRRKPHPGPNLAAE